MTNQFPPTDAPQSPTPSWTPEKQRTFLEALARCGSVKSAAAYVGMSRDGAYRLRRRDEGRAFARAWNAALIHARDLYADTLLDAKADGLDMAGDAAREAAADFDEMVEAIGEGKDCAAMLDEQDQAAHARRAAPPSPYMAELSDEEPINRIEMFEERQRIAATAPEDVDTSDLDPVEAEDWDDLQWARAERSGMMDEPAFWEKATPDGDDGEDGPDGPDSPDRDISRFH